MQRQLTAYCTVLTPRAGCAASVELECLRGGASAPPGAGSRVEARLLRPGGGGKGGAQ